MKHKTFTVLKEREDCITVLINGEERRLRRHVKPKYIAPSRHGKWWRVTGEGKGHSREIKVICNGVEYKSLSECARKIGVAKSTVSKALAGKNSKIKISKLTGEMINEN